MKIAIIDTLGLPYNGNSIKYQGLGGSESAVIYISESLTKIGFSVDVYNNCIDKIITPGIYNGVRYIDNNYIQNFDKDYDIVISSRSVYPFFANSKYKFATSAPCKILWMHDTFCDGDEHIESMLNGNFINEIFTLSDFHTSYVSNCDHGKKRMFEIFKHRIWQTRNGAFKWIDEVDLGKKDPNHFVYNASATKGLLPLLEYVWPEIKKNIPEAHLTVIGGYYRFKSESKPDQQEQTIKHLMSKDNLKDLGVNFTDVIRQEEIAHILSNATYMLYPPAFPETYGISSLESLLYKTPIITGNFGALEETAINLASYKINYPIEPNGLFPNIDVKEQAKKYIQLTLEAYNDPYLLKQKQNYCSVIDDVYSWDTIALQWKQHFYKIFKKYLSVDEYRRVTYINKKVSRIFGRRFENAETREEHISFGEQNRIVIVSPFWNAENYIQRCIESVAQQEYNNYLHVLIDDCSDDNSYSTAIDSINSLPKEIQNHFIVLKNTENRGAIFNQLSTIKSYANDDDIVMLLDGDDWLVNNPTIFHLYNNLYNQGYEFTYGSMRSIIDNIPLISENYPTHIKENKLYREHKFDWLIPYTHLRTFRKKLVNNINESQLKDENSNWMKAGADAPFFYELIEQADPNRVYCLKEIVYEYNDANPLNDYKIRGEEQNKNAARSFLKNDKKKKILIAIPTNKNIEPETYKSIYDLIVPDGYETEFQYFYGYRIDQVRNLISEWAKQYDYLFSVDSDIVLPKDTLVKMLGHNRDIVSGVYIQRIENQKIPEIYIKDQSGGLSNISYTELKTKTNLFQIDGCGFGCVLVKSDVICAIEYPHFYYQSALDHKDTVSEDIYFCMKATQKGFTIWADPTIRCDHIGQHTFSVLTDQEKFLQNLHDKRLLPKKHTQYLEQMNVKPKIVYDIGACVLHWTNEAKRIWNDAEFILFEALNDVKFLYNGYRNHLGVLTDTDNKTVDFYQDVYNAGGNSYYKENTPYYNESHVVKKTGMTLDTIVRQNNFPLPDLIKLDTQGTELDILKGASYTLSNCKDIILEAQHENYNIGAPDVEDVIIFMKSIGYELVSNFTRTNVDGDYHFKKIS